VSWKALYVSSRSEKKVAARLIELGIEAYVPLKKEKRQWSDRVKTVITPLINGYVFVVTDDKLRDEVFKANGVIQYVRYNGADAIITDKEIQVLKSIEEKGYHVQLKANNEFKLGDKTEIKHGPFKGNFGTIEKQSGRDQYTIVLESIGYVLKIDLPSEVLEKFSDN
jgi:transcription antitermination factor NusG